MMGLRLILLSLFFVGATGEQTHLTTQTADHSGCYAALRSGNLKTIDSEISRLKHKALPYYAAFEGALLIKKSGLISGAGEKLELFKQGRSKLEKAIASDSSNAEYHFLRLIVQENIPKGLQYTSHMREDASLLRNQYQRLNPSLQKEIFLYSKTSSMLRTEELHE